jgi:hypothetical protein
MRDGGKGDAQRPLTVPKEEFEANWDKIFKQVDTQEKQNDQEEKDSGV